MSAGAHFVTDLAVVLGVGAVTSVVARKLKQPTILGYLLAGLIVGPSLPIPIFADVGRVQAMAEFGVVLVMFAIGLEFRIAKLFRVLPQSGFAGLVQVSFLIFCGFSTGRALGWNTVESLFLGASIGISSTMVVSAVFTQQPVSKGVREHVLAILVLQDVMAIALIAVMTAVAAGGGLEAGDLAAMLLKLAGVLFGMVALGLLVVPRLIRAVLRLGSAEVSTVVAAGFCFAMAWLAEAMGYSVALGAFIAGILVAESGKGEEIEHLTSPLKDMFAAIFFVSIGMTVNPLEAYEHFGTAGIVFLVVVLAQLGSIFLGSIASGNSLRRSLVAGLALGQIGEFAFIISAIGITAGVAPPELTPILVTVAVLSALTTSIALKQSDRFVRAVDAMLPRRVQRFLTIYEEWFARMREQGGAGGPARKAFRAVVVDGVGLLILGALAAWFATRLAALVQPMLGTGHRTSLILVVVGFIGVSLPFVVGVIRNTLALAKAVTERIDDDRPASRVAVRMMRMMIYLLVGFGMGVPAVAIYRPLVGGLYGGLFLAGAVLGTFVYLWIRTGTIQGDIQSGAEQIAVVLARQAAAGQDDAGERMSNPTLVPGLDTVLGVTVHDGSYAVGKTLAEIDLRALTAATVVAIHRPATGGVVLPTGRERLDVGDVLAITGTDEALERAKDLVANGPSPELAAARPYRVELNPGL